MATTVYNVEEIQLQNGQAVKLKPLSIKDLRRFMVALQKTQDNPDTDQEIGRAHV